MSTTNMVSLIGFLLVGLAAWSQEFPAAEVEVGYSYARYAFSPYSSAENLNGGGGSATLNVTRYFGITVDVRGFDGGTAIFNIPANASFTTNVKATVDAKLSTYMIGPQFKIRAHGVHPFARMLVGGVHSHIYQEAFSTLCQNHCVFSMTPHTNAFAANIGGGIDVPVNKWVTVRPVDVSYFLTGFNNPFTNSGFQHHVRYSVGVVFTLDRTLY